MYHLSKDATVLFDEDLHCGTNASEAMQSIALAMTCASTSLGGISFREAFIGPLHVIDLAALIAILNCC